MVEDAEDDAVLVLRHLRRAFAVDHVRVAAPEDLDAQLQRGGWDIVLSDYHLPRLTGADVLARLDELGLDVPCVIVSGTIGEETAVAAMRAGARDYILKDNLKRLVPAIEREVAEHAVRRDARRHERLLRESEESFRFVIEQFPEAVLVHRDRTIVYANPAAVVLFGAASEGALVGRATDELLPSEGGEVELLRGDGTTVSAEVQTRPVTYAGASATLAVLRDLSIPRERAAKLVESDRMASVGGMAAGIAHEINNPLTYVSSNLQWIGSELDDLRASIDEPLREKLSEIRGAVAEAQEGAVRIGDVARDLRMFAVDDGRAQETDVRRVLDSSVKMATSQLGSTVRIARDYGDVRAVLAHPSRLGQVFVNLIVNASHAIEDAARGDGEIRLRVRGEGPLVNVDVEDDGVGIPDPLLPRIFTPFFTTKKEGRGTGLGLAICRRIVTAVGGTLSVKTKLGEGTTFTVSLPAADAVRVSAPS